MAHRLMNLWNVPGDEIDDIHELLTANAIDYYETGGGMFGLTTPALWLRDISQLTQARLLLDEYAARRAVESRQRWHEELAAGNKRTIVDMMREQPLKFFVYMALIAALLYISLVPVWLIGGK